MSRVLVIAGHHEGEFFQLPDPWPLNRTYRLPIRPELPIIWEPTEGPIEPLTVECVDYYIYQIRYRNTDCVRYVAMPIADKRDPCSLAIDSLFYTAEVKALGE